MGVAISNLQNRLPRLSTGHQGDESVSTSVHRYIYSPAPTEIDCSLGLSFKSNN